MLVVLPVVLMLGSITLRAAAAKTGGRVADLEARVEAAQTEKEALEVDVAGLSRPERIRLLAQEKYGMQDAAGTDIEVYGKDGEDGTENRGGQGSGAAP